MKRMVGTLVWAGMVTVIAAAERVAADQPLAWPPATRAARPWAYWWWHGSAVNPADLTRELMRYREAGMGGVHIIPIYGTKGYEERDIEYLSPRWMEMLRHTVSEGQRLNLGVDMTTGTGWCFGGPTVGDLDANALAVVKTWEVRAGQPLKETVDPKQTQALVAFGPGGAVRELTDQIAADGSVAWTAPQGAWRVYAVSQRPSGQRVKRAALGGAGHMLNLLYPDAVERYLVRFSEAFANYDGPRPRAMYHDSYEYRSDWSPALLAEFEKRRGYRLQTELPALFGKEENDRAARVKSDYRETVSDVMIERSLPTWVRWAHAQRLLTRNQAHGSPANLLDLYAAADIPETEMFRLDRSTLVSQVASSAAHVMGKQLVAAETGTWLKEHFTETLGDLKELVDQLFLAGVNHVVYHGTCYSPDEAAWPGWLFYASTEMNPRNSIWRDVPALNAYIARCQAVLQAGRPDNDLLVYWPIYDLWHNPRGLIQGLSVHGRFWMEDQPIGKLAQRLWERGFTYDFVSDRQLAAAQAGEGRIAVPGGNYRAVLVPPCTRMPAATLRQLLALAESGATVVFAEQLPSDVPGWGDLECRQAEFRKLRETVRLKVSDREQVQEAKRGQGRVLVGHVEHALTLAGVARESLTDTPGLQFIRRAVDGGRSYFVANRSQQPLDGWMPLATTAAGVGVLDPMTGQTGWTAVRAETAGGTEAYVQLAPGAALILRTVGGGETGGLTPADHRGAAPDPRTVGVPAWSWWQPAGAPVALTGNWQVTFVAGGPELPAGLQTTKLGSWTELGDPAAERFAGTARYRLTFAAPAAQAEGWLLDLGRVCQSARVRLNGHDLGTVFTAPFRVPVAGLRAADNQLEVEVTNVSANRIRDLDRRKVPWRIFHDINFVNQDYKPFDAANWPLTDSGLFGPVQMVPVQMHK